MLSYICTHTYMHGSLHVVIGCTRAFCGLIKTLVFCALYAIYKTVRRSITPLAFKNSRIWSDINWEEAKPCNFVHLHTYMKNLDTIFLHAMPILLKEPIGELNLKRALDEDTGVFSSFFHFFSTGSDSRFWEFHPSSVILGVFVFFFVLIFCESNVIPRKSFGSKSPNFLGNGNTFLPFWQKIQFWETG